MVFKPVGVDENSQFPTRVKTALNSTYVPIAAKPIVFSAAVATVGVTPTDRAYTNRTLAGARMRVAGAPVGSSLIAQVQHFDGTSWVTVGTLTIATGSTVEVTTSFVQAQLIGNLVRLNITSVGLTTAATGVAVDVLLT